MTVNYTVTVVDDQPDKVVVVKTATSPAERVTAISGQGPPGLSAYKVALDNGFLGNVYEWIDSLKGDSAYQVALDNGFVGTEEEWLETLKANINISPEVSGHILSNDGDSAIWESLETKLNGSTLTWDLGEFI